MNLGNGKVCPPFKLIILDEADSMTAEAQAALRRTMETWSRVTRFCIICNYVSRIIEPIASRCAKFRFKPLDQTIIISRLRDISEQEGATKFFPEEVYERVARLSEGDMRKGITALQSLWRLSGGHTRIQMSQLDDMTGRVSEELIINLQKSFKSNSFDGLQEAVTDIIADGYSAGQIFQQLHEIVINWRELSSSQKTRISMELARADSAVVEGSDEFLQTLSVCAFIMNTYNNA
eukprot:TRINITY_DN3354_c0_g1_i1.p1 TRINITY_DN3354_c0_g1~~TRINITY_DN3354_c0_g1_i1.p1  ORF type:complete len:235 (+),score=34.95 TRINITY_DN3354_c0_g1_i1:98-802(+)